MSTILSKTSRLVVAGVTGTAIALVPGVALAVGTSETTTWRSAAPT